MKNAFSIDLEYWWCNEFLDRYLPANRKDYFKESLKPLLDILDKYNTRATFFVLGIVAERYPEVIEDIYSRGHEIACHAYSHQSIDKLGKDGLEEEIKKTLKYIGKYDPKGFRAPNFSLNKNTTWAFEILEKYGFRYDSSIFPIKTMLYGVPDAPIGIYRPSQEDITINNPDGAIIEFPLTVLKMGINIPVAGGFYLRVLPIWFLKWAIKQVNKTRPAVIYIHPWETYADIPKIKTPSLSRFIAYHGVGSSLQKIEALLKEFTFSTVREVLNEI